MNTGYARVPGDPAGNLVEAGFSSPAHRQPPRAISPSSGDPPGVGMREGRPEALPYQQLENNYFVQDKIKDASFDW